MVRLIGWIFFLLNPFMGGAFLAGMGLAAVFGGNWPVYGIAISGVWILLYCLWFDGSRFQRLI